MYIIHVNFVRKKKAQQNDSLTFYTTQISTPTLLMRSSKKEKPTINILEKDWKEERSAVHKHFQQTLKKLR